MCKRVDYFMGIPLGKEEQHLLNGLKNDIEDKLGYPVNVLKGIEYVYFQHCHYFKVCIGDDKYIHVRAYQKEGASEKLTLNGLKINQNEDDQMNSLF